MYVAIGVVLTIVIAFGSPYFWNFSTNPSLFSALTTGTASLLFIGTGWIIDRRRKKEKSANA